MAYNYNNSDEGQSSKFNAGILQMNRLHELQRHLNTANLNPLAFDIELGVYNYQTIIDNTTNLVEEAGNKLSKDEKKQSMVLKDAVEKLIQKYPIHRFNPQRKKNILSVGNWEHLRKLIFYYQDYARSLLDKHNLNSPIEDESALF